MFTFNRMFSSLFESGRGSARDQIRRVEYGKYYGHCDCPISQSARRKNLWGRIILDILLPNATQAAYRVRITTVDCVSNVCCVLKTFETQSTVVIRTRQRLDCLASYGKVSVAGLRHLSDDTFYFVDYLVSFND